MKKLMIFLALLCSTNLLAKLKWPDNFKDQEFIQKIEGELKLNCRTTNTSLSVLNIDVEKNSETSKDEYHVIVGGGSIGGAVDNRMVLSLAKAENNAYELLEFNDVEGSCM